MVKTISLTLGSLLFSSVALSNVRNIPPVRSLLNNDFRTLDGSYNNKSETLWGAANTPLLRKMAPHYRGQNAPAGHSRKSPRKISNIVCKTNKNIPNQLGASDYLWQWGQFLDHDIDLTEPAHSPTEPFPIPIPKNDLVFNPQRLAGQFMSFNRSEYVLVAGVRQQINSITSYIDASNVYGSNPSRAIKLRRENGDTALLKTSAGKLLPFNTYGLPNAPSEHDPSFFLAGDIRANEQVGLASMHTLFVREHNFLVKKIRKRNPNLDDDKVYHLARKIVGAQMQVITYKEFLPVLLGGHKNSRRSNNPHFPLRPYKGYNENVVPDIANIFSTVSYRFGHSNLSPVILRLNKNLQEIPDGHLPLRDAFFNPGKIINEGGIEPILRGLAYQVSQKIDVKVIDDIRNFLFGPPPNGFDLASLNIQRGRDHGIPSYNDVREAFGLERKRSFSAITSNQNLQRKLKKAYDNVDNIDAWVGALAEDRFRDALVGQLNYVVIKDQFERLRDGDRYWYKNDLPKVWINWVENQSLKKIIVRNTSISPREIPNNLFIAKKLP
jgi:hypothetical protein